jgi:hypothetical protein
VKHYTADAFCALLLAALAVWTIEAEDATIRGRRLVLWWTIAAVTLWIANGAIFAAPACALLLIVTTWRQEGARGALRASAAGLIWLGSFALFYYLSLQYTLNSGFLWSYWAAHLPPGHGIPATLQWMAARLPILAENPGGTELWWGFWIAVLAGLAFGSRPVLRVLLAAVTLSIFVFAALGFFPFYERFVLWGVPALYLSMILLVDTNLSAAWRSARAGRWPAVALAALIAIGAGWICSDIVLRGWRDTRGRTADHKHGFDDRAAVEWLMEQRQPGDAVVTTRLAWPAVWWYGGISLASFDATTRPAPNLPAMYELTHERTNCPSPTLQEALRNHPRLLLYLGFRDVPAGFDELALANFGKSAALTAYREFAELSRAAVFDGREPSGIGQAVINRPVPETSPISGCAGLRPMERW